MDYKSGLGLLTVIIAVVSYSLYFRNIFRGKTKPHAISWLIWAVLSGVAFLTQTSSGAGAGGWITGLVALAALLIFITAIHWGERKITKLDWYCVVGALVSLSFWYQNRQSVAAVIFACLTFAIGFIPTFRKSYSKPRQETSITFFLNATKFAVAIAALDKFTTATVLYPATLALLNYGFVLYLIMRRQAVRF